MVHCTFEFMNPQNGKFKSLPAHKSLQDLHQNFDQTDLIDQNSFLLHSVLNAHVLPRVDSLSLGFQEFDVISEGGRETVQKVIVNRFQFLEGQKFKRKRSCFNNCGDIVGFDVKIHNLDEFKDFGVELLVVDFKMPWGDCHGVVGCHFHTEEFLDDEVSVLEIGVCGF